MALTFYHAEWGVSRPIRGVLFDMDGLILDTEILYSRFWQEAAAHFGYKMTPEQTLSMRAVNAQLGAAQLRSYFGPEADYNQIRNKRIQLMDAYVEIHGVGLKPGIRELLDCMDELGIPAAVTSSSPLPRIRNYLEFHGLEHRFAALCSGREVPHGKPEPDIYLHGAASLGLKAEECLALEDAPAGILSASRAGCLCVMVPDRDQPGPETAAMLYAKADSLIDVIDLLK